MPEPVWKVRYDPMAGGVMVMCCERVGDNVRYAIGTLPLSLIEDGTVWYLSLDTGSVAGDSRRRAEDALLRMLDDIEERMRAYAQAH